MEFEDMKKIWDSESNEALFVINESALHHRIRSEKNRSTRINQWNDKGLILIAIVTAGLLLILKEPTGYTYLSAIVMIAVAIYVAMEKNRRKRSEGHHGHTLVDELDIALANVDYEVRRSKTFVWWFLLPATIPALLNMALSGEPSWKWAVMPAAVVLAYFVVRADLKCNHLPKKRKLEELRRTLIE